MLKNTLKFYAIVFAIAALIAGGNLLAEASLKLLYYSIYFFIIAIPFAVIHLLGVMMYLYRKIIPFVVGVLLLIGLYWLGSIYGRKPYENYFLSREERRLPKEFWKYPLLKDQTLAANGVKILPFSKRGSERLENYVLNSENELVAFYTRSRDSEKPFYQYVLKYDTSGKLIDSLFVSGKRDEVLLVEDLLINTVKKTFSYWPINGDSHFQPLEYADFTEDWTLAEKAGFYDEYLPQTPFCFKIRLPKNDTQKEDTFLIAFHFKGKAYYFTYEQEIIIDPGDYNYEFRNPNDYAKPLFYFFRNTYFFGGREFYYDEDLKQPKDIEPRYLLYKNILTEGFNPLNLSRPFPFVSGEGILYVDLHVGETKIPFSVPCSFEKRGEDRLDKGIQYVSIRSEAVEACKGVYLYSNDFIKYRILFADGSLYMVL